METKVFFIIGVSGAGKSTLVSFLKEKLKDFEVHDFDEVGVPSNADKNWRLETTNSWIKRVNFYVKQSKKTIICGVCVPDEIRNCSNYKISLNPKFGFIKISEEDIVKRLKERKWSDEEINNNITWSKHLLKFVEKEKDHFIVNGSLNRPEEVANKFIEWIKSY